MECAPADCTIDCIGFAEAFEALNESLFIMPQIPIIMPQLGESIAEATVVRFLTKPGEEVKVDQDVLEVETNKATMNVVAPCCGKVERWCAELDGSYAVGAQLGILEVTEEEMKRAGLDEPVGPEMEHERVRGEVGDHEVHGGKVLPTVRGLPVPAAAGGASYMSPRLKARIAELGLHAADLAGVAGSGAGGRVTIQDFESFIQTLDQQKQTPASSMRVAVADAMRRSWTRPLATVGAPVRMDQLLEHRRSCDPKPGPALYVLRALALALAENSMPAGRLIGRKIVHPSSIDLGFAVEAEDGVLVPVVRHADQRSLAELVGAYNDLIDLAHRRRLPADATGGAIGVVTNFGTFGLTWATPIPLPEQTLVVGLGAGRKVPFWDAEKGAFIPVTESQLTLSFDHRVLDGGAAGRLLVRIAELMNRPEDL
jgi:pyruvate/2-oxoglutarate dehydrogenase complex dihydrolipoamide acyltransferase (E2) component